MTEEELSSIEAGLKIWQKPDEWGFTLTGEVRRLKARVRELEEKLGRIKEAVCRECSGSGEFGLADGEVPCIVCGGSGDPLKPGVFFQKPKGGNS
jgi:hypothetical protein